MSRKWLQVSGLIFLLLGLTGCNQSMDEQITKGFQLTENVFAEKPEKHTDTIGNIQLYLPSKYNVDDSSDKYNILVSKGKQSYILFINDREKSDSKLYYNLLKEDNTKEIIDEKTYEKDNVFGFAAVSKTENEEEFELVVSSGGVKMTTISPVEDIEDNLHEMTKIVHSVKIK
ncbi:hypothetical protein AEA09_02890 [Lysinibacillus contaminans]|uniref:Lipoprotein n=1 Tax=Lysinibacillus contaminans TaxID=1293441 RepID=A0ABR5JZN7_9BACI|nr:hypothetical protein [Lysinibacillus contaminans]KOS67604.1 hypothetical protein AEA09_02890 [Lysinibacillus contaminans]